MIRILWLFLVAVALAIFAAFVADQGGDVVVEWGAYEIRTSVGVAIALVLAVVATIVTLWRALGFFVDLPGALADFSRNRRRKKGWLALSRGMVAVAAGDVAEARRHQKRADSLIDDPPLQLLLAAQTAQLEGDEAAVARAYHKMTELPETEFLGLRGLFMQAIRREDRGAALSYVKRALELRPHTPWVVNALFDLHAGEGEWGDAIKALEAQQKAKVVDASLTRRRRAVLIAADALDADAAGDATRALARANEALSLAPGLTPAALLAARVLTAQGRTWKAAGIVEAAWAQSPHPDLAAAYAALKPGELNEARAKRMQSLISLNPTHPESRLLKAAECAAVKDWVGARAALAPLMDPVPTARGSVMMAAIEQGESGDPRAARVWLDRSVRAPRDGFWGCQSCGAEASRWSALCPQCRGFDTLTWRAPKAERVARLTQDAAGAPQHEDIARLMYRQGDFTIDEKPPERAVAPEPAPRERPPVVTVQPTHVADAGAFPAIRPPDDPGPIGQGDEEGDDDDAFPIGGVRRREGGRR